MGMQKLGYNMLRRLHGRSYSGRAEGPAHAADKIRSDRSRAQVAARDPARVPDTFLPLERAAAKVVLCTSLFYGFLFWMDFGGVRTVYRFVHDDKMEMEKRISEAELRAVIERKLEELRAEAERRDGKDDKLLCHA